MRWLQRPKIEGFWANAVLRSYSTFFLVDDTVVGAASIAVVGLYSRWSLFTSFTMCVIGNVFAVRALGVHPALVRSGLIGLNAVQLGLCLALLQPPSMVMLLPLLVLPCCCMAVQEPLRRSLEPWGLTVQGFPALFVFTLWKHGLSDVIGIFPDIPMGKAFKEPIDMRAGAHIIITSVANVGCLQPGWLTMGLLNLTWWLAAPAMLFSVWCGAVLGLAADLLSGAETSHIWTGLSGLNSILAFALMLSSVQKKDVWAYMRCALASFCAGLGSGTLGSKSMTWPCGFVLLTAQAMRTSLAAVEKHGIGFDLLTRLGVPLGPHRKVA